ncbi:hypothetical protein ACTWP4_13960 [Gracilibacillus sp. D59]|uniref:hypothetical protein n=1 Tax=Gracilibacillus sp. D59 TaxID=3457434 RepID=UPI003FCDE4D0
MKISFIRHGKSKCTSNRFITAVEFNDWVKNYDDSGVLKEDIYPPETLYQIQSSISL